MENKKKLNLHGRDGNLGERQRDGDGDGDGEEVWRNWSWHFELKEGRKEKKIKKTQLDGDLVRVWWFVFVWLKIFRGKL